MTVSLTATQAARSALPDAGRPVLGGPWSASRNSAISMRGVADLEPGGSVRCYWNWLLHPGS